MNTLKNADLLRTLGITELSENEKKSLNEKGYILFDDVLSTETLNQLSLSFEKAMLKEGFNHGRLIEQEGLSLGDQIALEFRRDNVLKHGEGQHIVTNLVNKGNFQSIYTHSKLLSAAYHLIGKELKLSSLMALEVVSGDRFGDIETGENVNCIVLLNHISEESGTFLVGDAPPLTASAGSVIVLNKNVKFTGTMNQSQENLRVIFCEFIDRDQKPKLNQWELIRRSTYLQSSPEAKYILNV